jgi:hypothetical protein
MTASLFTNETVQRSEPGTKPELVAPLTERRALLREMLGAREVVLPQAARRRARQQITAINDVLRLAARWEPTTPPETWHCGYFWNPLVAHSWLLRFWDGALGRPMWPWDLTDSPTWPAASGPITDRSRTPRVLVFTGPMPRSAQREADHALRIVGALSLTVYSPRAEDFAVVPGPVLAQDPVIIARRYVGETPYYFEVARWGVTEDLAELYRALVR